MKTHVKLVPGMGRGVFADHDIDMGRIVVVNELLVLSEADTVKVNNTSLKLYTFKYNDTQDCLCLGDGELFNHSDTPNVEYYLQNINGRKVMSFLASRDIVAGEQLFINYSHDTEVNIQEYL